MGAKTERALLARRRNERDGILHVGARLLTADEVARVLLRLEARRREVAIAHVLRVVHATRGQFRCVSEAQNMTTYTMTVASSTMVGVTDGVE